MESRFGGSTYDGESFNTTIASPDGLAITEQDPNQLLVLDDSSNTVGAFGLGGGAQLSTINLGAGSWEGISSIGDRLYVLDARSATDGDPLAVMKVWGLDGTRYAGEDLDLDVTLLTNETGVREARGIAVTADNIFVVCEFTYLTPNAGGRYKAILCWDRSGVRDETFEVRESDWTNRPISALNIDNSSLAVWF